MTNADNAGGLPKRGRTFQDVMRGLKREFPADWEIADSYVRALENKVIELCRAAPAGGDWRDAYEGAREDLLDWKGRAQRAEAELRRLGYTGITPDSAPAGGDGRHSTHHVHRGPESLPCYCNASDDHSIGHEVNGGPDEVALSIARQFVSADEPQKLAKLQCAIIRAISSAPAGSGEVGQLIGRLYAAARHVDMASKKLPDAFNGWEARDIAEAAALLRKLQQGAEYRILVAGEVMRETDEFVTDNGMWSNVRPPFIGMRYQNHMRTVRRAASQGQEGGANA